MLNTSWVHDACLFNFLIDCPAKFQMLQPINLVNQYLSPLFIIQWLIGVEMIVHCWQSMVKRRMELPIVPSHNVFCLLVCIWSSTMFFFWIFCLIFNLSRIQQNLTSTTTCNSPSLNSHLDFRYKICNKCNKGDPYFFYIKRSIP